MGDPFKVRVGVRGYELDTLGHLNQAVYLQYAEHARWEVLRAAGATPEKFLASRSAPVMLENTIRYRAELRAGDEVDVTCAFEWAGGKTFRLRQELRKPDGTLSAEVTAVGGILDLDARRLVVDPRAHLRKLADNPEILDA
ncbi:acyl-CoA thioesterase [Phytohabitans sp. LJ34]|uniref:acyl-CoA thioesterase n=1 Tax=Phytohabitans sp. LJ34 TaxID=3452217 RepID=UPI003F8C2A6D